MQPDPKTSQSIGDSKETVEPRVAPLPLKRFFKGCASGRNWDSGRVCRDCQARAWATRTLKGRAYTHLGADGKWFKCSAFADPVYACECGKKKRSWGGPPRGWTQVHGFSALCTKCSKPKKQPRKSKAPATPEAA